MKNNKAIELTITPNYVSDWDFCDAVRELIQNGIDQETLDSENAFDISYDEEEKTLQLCSPKSSLEINTLLLGCSTKTVDSQRKKNCSSGVTTKKHKAALEVMKSCQIEVTNSQKTK